MEITVRPIHNEEDYEAALAEVDSLMDAVPGTPEGTA
jgi:antitoxin component HigA of HigAB toxin-antitoxin module